jgi:hypothetical protein
LQPQQIAITGHGLRVAVIIGRYSGRKKLAQSAMANLERART